MGYQLVSHLPGVNYNRSLFYLDADSPVLPPVSGTTIAPGSIAEDKSRAEVYYLASNLQWYKQQTAGGVLPTITGGPGYTLISYLEGMSDNAKEYYIDNATDLATIMTLDYVDAGSIVMLITNGVKYRKESDGDWYIDISGQTSGGGGGGGTSYTWSSDGSSILTGLTSAGGTSDQKAAKFKLGDYTSSKGRFDATMTFEEVLQSLEKALVPPLMSAPTPAAQGDMYYDIPLGQIMVYNGTAWITTSAAPAAATAPTTAVAGMTFFNTTDNQFYYYTGTEWKSTNATYASATPPTTTYTGQTYYNTDSKIVYVYDGTKFVPVANTKSFVLSKTPVYTTTEATIQITATDLGVTDTSQIVGFPIITLIDETSKELIYPDKIDNSVKSSTVLCDIIAAPGLPSPISVIISAQIQ